MAIAIGSLERDVLQVLQKSPGAQGYYTADKLRTAVQECFDYVATIMFDSEYGGWMDEIRYFTTTAGDAIFKLPADLAQIKVVRYQVNGVYKPLAYDKQEESLQTDPTDATTGNTVSRYRLIGEDMYFNPALFDGGTNYLQIEGTYYPERFKTKLDKLSSIWNPAFRNFIKYRSASILISHKLSSAPPWAGYENQWHAEVRKLISKRVNTVTTIKEFDG